RPARPRRAAAHGPKRSRRPVRGQGRSRLPERRRPWPRCDDRATWRTTASTCRAPVEEAAEMATEIAVAGATGMLGRRICALLRDRGESVRALVRPGPRPEE